MNWKVVSLVGAVVIAGAGACGSMHSQGFFDPYQKGKELLARQKREEMKQWQVQEVIAYLNREPEWICWIFPDLAPDRQALEQKLREAKAEVLTSSLPLESYDAMVAEITASLRAQIHEIATRTPAAGEGGTFAFVVGDFRNNVSGKPTWLNDTLRTVAITLSNDDSLPSNVTIVEIGSFDPQAIINQVADAEGSISIDESNVQSVRTVKFHPDDVYVLTGAMSEQKDVANYRVEFVVSAELHHPRTQRLVKGAQDKQMGYLYHPIREKWITDSENSQLKTTLASASR